MSCHHPQSRATIHEAERSKLAVLPNHQQILAHWATTIRGTPAPTGIRAFSDRSRRVAMMSESGKLPSRRVFISHARADEAWAAWMTAALRRHGVEVLTPETVTPGTAWADAARAAIAGADEVLFVLSGASTRSPSVALELEAAKAAGRPITYITVDPGQPLGTAAS